MALTGVQTFAGYTIVRLLGSGGMGEVYLAKHPRLPREDALKLLPPDWSADADYRIRFTREADLASTLWHPNIVGVHDRGESDGQLWISMDYVDGLDANRLLAERYPSGIPPTEVGKIVSAVASALDGAHKKGLLHRDVKPANIMLTHLDDDGEQRILLADFGIARDVNEISGITTTNMTVGTVAYCAPEQLLGEEVDGRADQYALAATAYHLLTGEPMFAHSNPAVVISRHLNSPPPPLADTRPELADFDPVLATGLAKNPNDRFASCSDFARAFNARLGGSGAPSPSALTLPAPVARSAPVSQPATGSTPVTAAGRSWVLVAVAATVIVVLAGVALVWRPWANRAPTVHSEQTAAPSSPAAVPSAPSPLPPPAPPTLPASAIDRVLLSDGQLNNLLGTTTASGQGGMELTDSVYGMVDNSKLVTPPNCSGVVFAAEPATYADTEFEAIRHEAYKPHTYVFSGREPFRVEQTVAVYPSHERAEAVLSASERQWNQCADGDVREFVPPEDGRSYTFGAVQRNGDLLFVPMASSGPTIGAHACQRVLGVRFNVVVGTRSCDTVDESRVPPYDQNVGWVADPQWASDDAERLAAAMLANVTP